MEPTDEYRNELSGLSVNDSGVESNAQGISGELDPAVILNQDVPGEGNQDAPGAPPHQAFPVPARREIGHQNDVNSLIYVLLDENSGLRCHFIGRHIFPIFDDESVYLRFHFDGRHIYPFGNGSLTINKRVAKIQLANFRACLDSFRRCATCFRYPRALVNCPCMCVANCVECAPVMELCSICYCAIQSTAPCRL